jgi:hypothetical protein
MPDKKSFSKKNYYFNQLFALRGYAPSKSGRSKIKGIFPPGGFSWLRLKP